MNSLGGKQAKDGGCLVPANGPRDKLLRKTHGRPQLHEGRPALRPSDRYCEAGRISGHLLLGKPAIFVSGWATSAAGER